MADKAGYQSSGNSSDEWETPDGLFSRIDGAFRFTLDACATRETSKCKRYFSREQNGLRQDWGGETVWCNPPYSEWKKWVRKASLASDAGALSVVLIPPRTDTVAWHEDVVFAEHIIFLRKRVNFILGGKVVKGNPAPSCLVVFAPHDRRREVDRAVRSLGVYGLALQYGWGWKE